MCRILWLLAAELAAGGRLACGQDVWQMREVEVVAKWHSHLLCNGCMAATQLLAEMDVGML